MKLRDTAIKDEILQIFLYNFFNSNIHVLVIVFSIFEIKKPEKLLHSKKIR